MELPSVGELAPDFEAITDEGKSMRLSDHQGTVVVLYFYPRADTPGCTKEACGFRDDYSTYEDAKVVILGVSPDSVKDQAKFKKKFELPFTLLADEDHKIADQYSVWGLKNFMGREYDGVHRTTFLIGEDGKILAVFEKVKPSKHSEEILASIPTG
jgi:peroxiredoxin Q/BCP